MPLENPELEITLTRREAGAYWARFRLRQPGGEAAVDHEANVTFDPGDLNGAAHTPDQYGAALSRALFAHERLRLAWNGAMAAAKAPLRVRLALDVDDLTLRRVRWEALADPGTGKRLLLTDQRIWFSRYLNSPSNASIRVRTKPALRALVAVAAPANLDNLRVGGRTFTDDDRFSPAAEIAEVRRALGPMTEAVTELPHDKAGPATRDNILKHLRTGYDLFYLVAHGALAREGDTDVPKLLLVNDQGAGEEVDGREFAAEIGKLWHRPVLIVLSSCQSAGATQPFRAGRAAAGRRRGYGPGGGARAGRGAGRPVHARERVPGDRPAVRPHVPDPPGGTTGGSTGRPWRPGSRSGASPTTGPPSCRPGWR